MIAAEASRREPSAVDVAMTALDYYERDRQGGWDPRLAGAALDALARAGRAEEAQALLERALGTALPRVDGRLPSTTRAGGNGSEGEARDGDGDGDAAPAAGATRCLNPSRAGRCYDALLRAWAARALDLARAAPEEDSSDEGRDPLETGTTRAGAEAEKEGRSHDVDDRSGRSAVTAAMAQARRIALDHMPSHSVPVTNRTCAAVLAGYASLGMSAEAERTLVELEALHAAPADATSSSPARPSSLDTACYNAVLHAHGESRDPEATTKAATMLAAMQERTPWRGGTPGSGVSVVPPRPDLVSYATVLRCHAERGAVDAAEALLNDLHHDGRQLPPATVACYLPVVQALGRSDARDAPERVLEWLARAGARRGAAARVGRERRPLYVAALRCMARHGRGEEAEAVLREFRAACPGRRGGPGMAAHASVLQAWEKTKAPRARRAAAAARAGAFVRKMERRARAGLLPRMPDVAAYDAVLGCCARGGEAAEAERLLAALEGTAPGRSDYDCGASVRPSTKSYVHVIKAWALSDAHDAVERARHVLYRLGFPRDAQAKVAPGSVDIPIEVFNSLLRLYAKRGLASEAEALFSRIDRLMVEGAMTGDGPDIRSYEAVLEALGRCKDADAPARAESIVTRLEVTSEMGGGARPTLLAYNSLLNCYANAGMAGKAERLLERLTNPDSVSFASTMKAIANSGQSQVLHCGWNSCQVIDVRNVPYPLLNFCNSCLRFISDCVNVECQSLGKRVGRCWQCSHVFTSNCIVLKIWVGTGSRAAASAHEKASSSSRHPTLYCDLERLGQERRKRCHYPRRGPLSNHGRQSPPPSGPRRVPQSPAQLRDEGRHAQGTVLAAENNRLAECDPE